MNNSSYDITFTRLTSTVEAQEPLNVFLDDFRVIRVTEAMLHSLFRSLINDCSHQTRPIHSNLSIESKKAFINHG